MQSMENEVIIPRSVQGLVTGNLLVMSLLDGMPITRMQVCSAGAGSHPAMPQGRSLQLRPTARYSCGTRQPWLPGSALPSCISPVQIMTSATF